MTYGPARTTTEVSHSLQSASKRMLGRTSAIRRSAVGVTADPAAVTKLFH